MPLYDYECKRCCQVHERYFRMADMPNEIDCPCGWIAKRVIVRGHGGLRLDDQVSWLNDEVREVLQDSDMIKAGLEKPIETRGEWKSHLKKHNIMEAG